MTVLKKKKLKLICHDYEVIIILGNFLNLSMYAYKLYFWLISFFFFVSSSFF